MSVARQLVVTSWKCNQCETSGSFEHDGLVGSRLIEEVKVHHFVASPRCQWWDDKITLKRIK